MAGRSARSPTRTGERSFALHYARYVRRTSTMPSENALVHIIDDDEAVRHSLAFLLGTAGIDVKTYDSAIAFLEDAPKVKAGCVITDVRMPGLSGIELL